MKTTENPVWNLLFPFMGIIFMVSFMSSHAKASVAPIKCVTAYGEKEISIREGQLSMSKAQKDGSRSISSVGEAKLQRKLNGIQKTMYLNGNKHVVHIENLAKFDDANDYLAITSPEGHKMTYPLTCKVDI